MEITPVNCGRQPARLIVELLTLASVFVLEAAAGTVTLAADASTEIHVVGRALLGPAWAVAANEQRTLWCTGAPVHRCSSSAPRVTPPSSVFPS